MLVAGQIAPASVSFPGIVNLSTNPSFETDVLNWSTSGGVILQPGATLTRITTSSFSGSASGQVVTTAAAGSEGIRQTISGLTIGLAYTFSVYIQSVSGGTSLDIGLGTNAGTIQGITITTSWARYSVTHSPTATSRDITIFTPSAVVATFNVDAVMVTLGSSPPTYGDGNTAGWTWSGTTNDSTSTGPATTQTEFPVAAVFAQANARAALI